jgi:hypothetical protein
MPNVSLIIKPCPEKINAVQEAKQNQACAWFLLGFSSFAGDKREQVEGEHVDSYTTRSLTPVKPVSCLGCGGVSAGE